MKPQIQLLLLIASLSTVSPLRAQIVADGATNTLSNITNFFTGDVTVGTNGAFTLLVLSDNTLLTNSANVIIGRNTTAKSNEVRLVSSSARWLMGGLFAFPTVHLGSNGAFNRLVVSNGATMQAFSGNVGVLVSASNNLALVTGPGSLLNFATLFIGSSGAGNQVIVSDGGILGCASSTIGTFPGSSNNLAVVTGPGSTWTNQNNLTVGLFGVGNQLLVSAGGAVRNANGFLGADAMGSNNLALLTGAGSVWSNALNLEIGSVSANNQLSVRDGATVFVAGNGSIGSAPNAKANSVVVADPGSSWLISTNLYVGSNGAFNLLVVTNGALAVNSNGYLGFNVSGSNNLAVITGAGSLWSNRNDFIVGNFGVGNQMVISNGAAVHIGRDGLIGGNSSARSNSVTVTGPGTRWRVAGTRLYVGSNAPFSQLVISNGALVDSSSISTLGGYPDGSNNQAVVTGPGSIWSNQFSLHVGVASDGNQLMVANGGQVRSGSGTIGLNNSRNLALVTGVGSMWTNHGDLSVGVGGSQSQLVVSNSGTAAAGQNVIVGYFPSGTSNNRLTVDGGTLRATNASSTGALDVRRGTNVFNAGLIDVDQLVLTNRGVNFIPTVFSNRNLVTIPSGSTASPYPSTISVSGLAGVVTKVTVKLFGLSHTFPDDVDILLVSPGGQKVMLMSDAGGGTDITSAVFFFEDGAAAIPNSTAIPFFGTYSPTDYEPGETLPAPAPAGPYSVTLSSFNGSSPNGSWRLYINDDANPDSGSLVEGWGLEIAAAGTLAPDRGAFEFNGGTLLTRGAVINNGAPFVVGATGSNPATWDVRASTNNHSVFVDLIVGANSSFNQLILTNGALLTNSSSAFLGREILARSNHVTLAGAGSRWWLGDTVIVGNWGSGNRLVVSNGASFVTGSYSSIGHESLSTNNEVVVTGPGSTWTSEVGQLFVGAGGRDNRLLVNNGGLVVSFAGTIGDSFADSSNNLAVVSGAGSSWSNAFELRVGDAGTANRLIVSNSAVVSAGSAAYLGFASTATNNQLTVNNGTLRVTNASATGTLDVRRGTTTLNAGLVEVDRLLITNIQGGFQLNGGTLSTRNTTINNGLSFHVGNNVGPATFLLAGNGTHVFSGSLTVDDQGTLAGNGTIIGTAVVLDGGIVSPGASIGKIIFNPAGVGPLLFGTMAMEISKNGTALTNDQVQVVGGTLGYGGDLVVTHLGPTPLAGGDKFKLFDAPFFAGSFQSITLPPLGPGLRWVTNLLVDGSIEVFAPPPVGAGFALNFDGTNDFVQVSADSRFNAYPLVATAWINTTQTNGEAGIINKYVAGSFNGWQIALANGEVRAWYARNNANSVGGGGYGVNGGPVSDGEWHHVAFTVDDTGGSLYVDGFFKEKLAWLGTPGSCTTTQVLSLARYPGGTGEFFRGTLDEVAIWNGVAPSPAEIKTNLNRGLLGSETGLVLYHRYTEGSGTFAQNASEITGGFGMGFLQNGVTWVPGIALRPAIRTKIAMAITVNSATLHGEANPAFTNTTAWFEWGTTTNYGNVTSVQSLGSGSSNTNLSQSLTGLTENVTYHFRAVAANSIGASFGANKSFVATGTNMLAPRIRHTASLLPNGKVLVAGGQSQNFDVTASAELYDPASGTWAVTAAMTTNRESHTATVLPNGKVLVVGGENKAFLPYHASAELYDPATGTWALTGSLRTNRVDHTATLLFNGKVLVAGGSTFFGPNVIAELYDPATGTWTETGAPLATRYGHTTTLLPNGKVLVAGGRDGNNIPVAGAELYDPVSGTWTNTGSMTTNRASHTATLLRNGKVLVVGGSSGSTFLRSAELYDPVAGTWTATGAMLNYRFDHTATLLPDGKVFASGVGIGAPSVYNPISGTWTDVPGPDPNGGATATLLANGKVLIAGGGGGFSTDGDPTTEAELFDPGIGSWSVAAPMANARDAHTATLLPNGRVLVASFTNSEIFNPITGTWSNTGPLKTNRNNHTATLLLNGKVLAVGGINFSTTLGAELYDAASGVWTNTGSLATNRIGGHRATLLLNGKVLVTGGNDGLFTPPVQSVELYDPTTGNWTNTGSMTTNRSGHTATLLPNGNVLVAGGFYTGGFFPSVTPTAELYDPFTGLWTAIPSMSTNRSGHIAVLLPNGKVLIAGGSFASLVAEIATAELYDPATGTWKATGSMILGRSGATATLLPNGKVLVAAGYNANAGGYLSGAELYDPQTGKWAATAPLGAAHNAHTSTLLPDGRVLVTGGNFGSGITNRVELYDVGLGFTNSWRPQIFMATSPLNWGGSLVIAGAQFRGLSAGSGGNASQDSPTDYPVVQLRSLENAHAVFLPGVNWSTNSFTSAPVNFPPGFAMTTVFVNGIPSVGQLLNINLPVPIVTTSNASNVTATSATLNGVVNPNANATTAYFQWGTTTNYGNLTATTNTGNGTSGVAVAIGIIGLTPVTTYHFRMVGSNSLGLGFGADQNFTTLSTNANLASLTSTAGIFTPVFNPGVTNYTVFVDNTVTSATVTPTAAEAGMTIQVRVNGGSFSPVTSGNASGPLAFNAGNNLIEVQAAAPDPAFTKTYALAVTRLGQANHLIYTDQLVNGFQALGGMTFNLANTSPVHSGGKSISATIATGGQEIYLVRSAMDSTPYSSVSFWINGGPSGGQQLLVYGILDFIWQSSYAVGPLPANTWQHFTIPLTLLGAANKTNFNGIVFQDNSGTAQPTFYLDDIQLDGVQPPALVNVTVSATQIGRTVDARLFGVNAAAWDGDLDSPSTISVLTDMDNQVLRWPGGSWGDIYHESAPPNVGWGSYTSNFIHVATNTRAQVFMIANYGTGTPQEAANWVRYCNVTNQAGFKYWEIGNEVFGSWEEDHNTNAPFVAHDPWTYAMRFKDYYTQMKAVDPTIKIGAVAEVGEDNWANNTNHPALNPRTGLIHNGWVPVMLTTLKTNGVTPDFLIHHKYAPTGSDANNLLWSSTWASDAASMRQMLTDYLGDAGTNTELVCTEHGPGGNKQKTSLVGGLFWADSLGQILQTEFNARVWWDLRNGQSAITPNPLLYGWRNYYDEGIVVGQAEPANRYPTFYCGKLMKYFARGGDQVVGATNDFPLLATYAVRRANGSLSLLVINKSPYDTLTAGISLAGYVPSSNATIYSYGIPQDEAARTNAPAAQMDITMTNLAVTGYFTHAFPPYSATVISFSTRDFGVDVSHFQGESGVSQAAWNQMFADGKRFVFIKATEGLTGPHDATMATNVTRASAAGLLVGVYHYAHPENRPTTNGAILEASNMVVYAGSAIGPGRLRPVLDLEGSAATLSTTALTDWVIAFSNEIIARRGPGAAPIIYCSQTFANNEFDSRLANYDLWLRTVGSGANPAVNDPPGQGFADATGVFNNWSFWQYSATGNSGGISPLDLNVCHNDFKPLSSFLITNAAPVAIQLSGLNMTVNGVFQFSFTNTPGALFTVLASTNAALPLISWDVLGGVTEISPGQFQFNDTQATNQPQRFYRVRSP